MAKPNKLQDVLDTNMENIVSIKDLEHFSVPAASLNQSEKKKKKKKKKKKPFEKK